MREIIKYLTYLSLLFQLLSFMCFAQIDSLKEVLKYNPVQTGNYWEYKNYYWDWNYFYSTAHSINVIGDTLFSNSYEYKILIKKNIPDDGYSLRFYERVDSLTACVYKYSTNNANEYLIDSLLAEPGDTIMRGGSITLCVEEYEDTILGILTEVKAFEDQTIIPVLGYRLAKNFGFIGSGSCEYGCASTILVYAIIDGSEYGDKITNIIEPNISMGPIDFDLYQNYPNPFNPSTIIRYEIPGQARNDNALVTLKVYDVLGNEVTTLVNEEKPAGSYEVDFDGNGLSSGIYFYRLSVRASTGAAQHYVETKKTVLLR
jgi:Secretion system C-terminal sorting domain